MTNIEILKALPESEQNFLKNNISDATEGILIINCDTGCSLEDFTGKLQSLSSKYKDKKIIYVPLMNDNIDLQAEETYIDVDKSVRNYLKK